MLARTLDQPRFSYDVPSGSLDCDRFMSEVRREEVRLGRGATAKVYRVVLGDEARAVKQYCRRPKWQEWDTKLSYANRKGANRMKESKPEIHALRLLVGAPNVVRMFAHSWRPELCALELECMDGPLTELLPLPLDQSLHIVDQLQAGVAAIHALGVWHRDIYPGNVLHKREAGETRVVLADFGLAWFEDCAGEPGNFVGHNYYGDPRIHFDALHRQGPEQDYIALGIMLVDLEHGVDLLEDIYRALKAVEKPPLHDWMVSQLVHERARRWPIHPRLAERREALMKSAPQT